MRRLAFLLVVTLFDGGSTRAETEVAGRFFERVTCEAAPGQAYALYVPSGYTTARSWPVIFCFDPGAKGGQPVSRLQAAAEKYGYLVAGSLNSRNGPWADNHAALNAMVKDVSSHFSVDRQRIYTAGLSGGARVATAVALSGFSKGVLACGAGFPVLPDGLPPEISFPYFATVGLEDFNYSELMRLEPELEKRGARHRIVTFNGGHEWPSAELFMEAVEWLELHAMHCGTQPQDDLFIQAQLQKRLANLPAPPTAERWKALRSVARDFSGLADVAAAADEAEALGRSPGIQETLKGERTLLAREENLVNQLARTALGGADEKRSLAKTLKAKAQARDDTPERRMVRRVLSSYVSITRETARGLLEEHDIDKAVALLEFAVLLKPEQFRAHYDLAKAYSVAGDRKRAIEALDRAFAAGFNDPSRAEKEPVFAKLTGDAGFQKVLAKMRQTPEDGALELPAMRISAALESVELRLFYLPHAATDTPPLSFLRIESVRGGTTAADAGLQPGMEVTAIQGVRIRGLTQVDLLEQMDKPVRQHLTLTVRESRAGRERIIHVPLKRSPAVASGKTP